MISVFSLMLCHVQILEFTMICENLLRGPLFVQNVVLSTVQALPKLVRKSPLGLAILVAVKLPPLFSLQNSNPVDQAGDCSPHVIQLVAMETLWSNRLAWLDPTTVFVSWKYWPFGRNLFLLRERLYTCSFMRRAYFTFVHLFIFFLVLFYGNVF